MRCCDLSQVIDNSFHNQFTCQTFWQIFMVIKIMNKSKGQWNKRMLSIIDTGNALLCRDWYIFHHFQKRMMCIFSVFSYDYFMRNYLWLFIALYFEIKGEWQLRQMMFFSWIRLCFHLQPFSHCQWYFLIDELWNKVSCIIMLLLLPSSLRCILLIGVAIMTKRTLFSFIIFAMYYVYISYHCITWCKHLFRTETFSTTLSIVLCQNCDYKLNLPVPIPLSGFCAVEE